MLTQSRHAWARGRYLDVDYQTVRPDMACKNWIFIRPGVDDKEKGFDLVLQALHTVLPLLVPASPS